MEAAKIRKLQLVRFCIEHDDKLKKNSTTTTFQNNKKNTDMRNIRINVNINDIYIVLYYTDYQKPCKCCFHKNCVLGERYIGFIMEQLDTNKYE